MQNSSWPKNVWRKFQLFFPFLFIIIVILMHKYGQAMSGHICWDTLILIHCMPTEYIQCCVHLFSPYDSRQKPIFDNIYDHHHHIFLICFCLFFIFSSFVTFSHIISRNALGYARASILKSVSLRQKKKRKNIKEEEKRTMWSVNPLGIMTRFWELVRKYNS